MTIGLDRLMTAEEYARLATDERTELVRGRVIVLVRPKPKHGRVAQNISRALDEHVRPRKLGQVYGSEIGYLVENDPDSVRAPDVSFVRAEVADAHDEDAWYPHSPDLAVEVVSPNDTRAEVEEKVGLWLAHGARAVWVVDPQRRGANLHRRDGTTITIDEAGELVDDSILPGFSLPLRNALDD